MDGMLVKYGVAVALLFAVFQTPYPLSYPAGSRINIHRTIPLPSKSRLGAGATRRQQPLFPAEPVMSKAGPFTDGRRFSRI